MGSLFILKHKKSRKNQTPPYLPLSEAQTQTTELLQNATKNLSQFTTRNFISQHRKNISQHVTARRIGFISLFILIIHLLLFFGIFPYLELSRQQLTPTEMINISPSDLEKIKKRILSQKNKPPLLKQELREQFKTNERPEDAQFIGAFNQKVTEQTVAGAQRNAPQVGGGQKSKPKPSPQMHLSQLGLGTKLPPPLRQEQSAQAYEGPNGPPGLFNPVGREDPNLKRGQDNLLNAMESEYYSFFSRFEEPLIRNWHFLLRSQEGQIHQERIAHKITATEIPMTVEFVIDRSGNFISIKMIENSGIPTLDHLTVEAIKKLRSLPNPPAGLFEGGQYFTYRVRFGVYVQDGPMFQSTPDVSWY